MNSGFEKEKNKVMNLGFRKKVKKVMNLSFERKKIKVISITLVSGGKVHWFQEEKKRPKAFRSLPQIALKIFFRSRNVTKYRFFRRPA